MRASGQVGRVASRNTQRCALLIFGLPVLIGLVALGVAARKAREAPRGAGG